MASKRLYSLDILRGLTVMAMIVVNNAGGKESYHPLKHSAWHGLTLCDMVFPTFLFIVGISTYISLKKVDFQWSMPTLRKVLWRTAMLLLIGWALHLIENICKGKGFDIGELRLTGVLPRIAICYFAVSVLALSLRRKYLIAIAVLLLAAYSCILLLGNGLVNEDSNLLVRIDRAVLGASHLYAKQPVDPEGLTSTISAIAHTLIGFCMAPLLFDKNKDAANRLLAFMAIGFALWLAGMALEQVMPLNKRIWTPSYTLVTCALGALALGLIGFITDINGKKAIFKPFDVFGVNPLFLYALAELLAIILSATKAKAAIYNAIAATGLTPCAASAVYSLLFAFAIWCAGYPLYKRKIYIKL